MDYEARRPTERRNDTRVFPASKRNFRRSQTRRRRAHATAFWSRQAIVIGPTPPGTGVRCEATSAAPGIDVADEPGLGPVDADVDHGRAGLDHVGRDDRCAPRRDHEDVGVERVPPRSRVCEWQNGHGGVRLLEELRDGLAHDRAAPDDHGAGAVELDPVFPPAAPSPPAQSPARAGAGRAEARRHSTDGNRRRPSPGRRHGSPVPRRRRRAAAAERGAHRRPGRR